MMASFSPLVSLLVAIVINLLRAECWTRAGGHSRRPNPPSSLSNKLCLDLCGWSEEHQRKRKMILIEECIKDCEQGKTPRALEKEHDLALGRLRVQRSVKTDNKSNQPKNCLGFSDDEGHSGLPPGQVAKISKVEVNVYKINSSEQHNYSVSWEPLDDLLKGVNWTDYSLLYRFHNDYNEKEHSMECVLVPKNQTYFVLKHDPLWSPNGEPDKLLCARYSSFCSKIDDVTNRSSTKINNKIKNISGNIGVMLLRLGTNNVSLVVSYPFVRNKGGRIELHSYDPLKPTYTPDFTPILATSKAPIFKIVASIVGGVTALLVILLISCIVFRRRKLCSSRDPVIVIPPANPSSNNTDPVIVIPPANPASNNTEPDATPNHSSPEMANELYYCCYYPESDAFRDRVASIVNLFRERGYDVIMDAMNSSEISSQGPTRWAETQIRRASKVLVFLSPGLLRLAFDGCEGLQSQDVNRVWIELEVLQSVYSSNHSASKMVCITLPRVPGKSLHPPPLWVKVIYKWPDDFEKILRRLNDRPTILPHM